MQHFFSRKFEKAGSNLGKNRAKLNFNKSKRTVSMAGICIEILKLFHNSKICTTTLTYYVIMKIIFII